ncbi:Cytochrome P450 CYP6 [Frankliniella occidentalis]|uniref:Probable cytochrome P450 6a13 n=1 Tax=Frankliniella occidentalis TaxID=133901 RepID=A0A6J1RYK6_FRAOC|nr:probable cytochrome P450 6a13 [Frankliniella occidentalis]KAE8752540.1 Cytochrome P450 CYP6 [Frankliniella occidentalis]
MELTTILAAAAAVLATLYLYYSYRFSYWRKRGVPFPRPLPFLGNIGFFFAGKKGFSSAMLDLVAPFKENGYCGMYMWSQPVLLVWDPEMTRQIICKDFSSFHDRGQPSDENDPLSQHLFNLNGNKWRNLRNRLTPTFTSGKLKLMLPMMRDIASQLSSHVATEAKRADEVEIDALLSRYAVDVIGSVAFGIECNSLRDKDNEFISMSRKLGRTSAVGFVRFILIGIHPKLGALLPLKWMFSDTHRFFLNLMKETVEYREQHDVERNDFVQLMMQLRSADLANVDPANHMALTHGVMAAQALIFFLAGLDSVSNTIAFALSRLGADPELQQRLADEVREVLRRHAGELSYEALKEMDLLHRVVLEAMRLWNPAGILFRKCNATTQVGDLVVEKGQVLFIMAQVTAMDEGTFPDPHRFDPGRHTPEAKQARHPYAFLPFGDGPRNCIAERFAMLEMKLTVALLVRDFVFTPGPNYEPEVELDPKNFFPRAKNGFHLKVSARA